MMERKEFTQKHLQTYPGWNKIGSDFEDAP